VSTGIARIIQWLFIITTRAVFRQYYDSSGKIMLKLAKIIMKLPDRKTDKKDGE
jgi:hypothetical protein